MIALNEVYCDNAYKFLRRIDNNSIDIVVTSPPYDNLRKYNSSNFVDGWNEGQFKCIARELKRVLKDGGVIVWNVFDKVENGNRTDALFRQCLYFQEFGLNINGYMIFAKTNPIPQVRQPRYSFNFEFMWILLRVNQRLLTLLCEIVSAQNEPITLLVRNCVVKMEEHTKTLI